LLQQSSSSLHRAGDYLRVNLQRYFTLKYILASSPSVKLTRRDLAMICADCNQTIDPERDHTCAQQVKANQLRQIAVERKRVKELEKLAYALLADNWQKPGTTGGFHYGTSFAPCNGVLHATAAYRHECKRCAHVWTSLNAQPLRCAACKSPYWQTYRKSDLCAKCSCLLTEVDKAAQRCTQCGMEIKR
jgi:hypothetical protein